jgi:hypothetical protein
MRTLLTLVSQLVILGAGCAAQSPSKNGGGSGKADGADSIPDQVKGLEDQFPLGLNNTTTVQSTDPLTMVQQYVAAVYPDYVATFQFQTNGMFTSDTAVAGTVTADAARAEVHSWLTTEAQTEGVDVAVELKKADDRLDAILEAGGSFGFDGYGENGCAAPTETLLVLDPAGPTVTNIDLNPCME